MSREYFELHRLSDERVYQFDRKQLQSGGYGYQRRDMDLWIEYRPQLGWVAWNEEDQSVAGRPWHILPQDQDPDYPPQGEWVSKKETKSYVYELKYMEGKK